MQRLGVLSAVGLMLIAAAAQAAEEPDQAADTTLSPWGIGGDYTSGKDVTRWIPQMTSIGVKMMRCCYPYQMAFLTNQHIQFGGLFYGVPKGDKIDAPGSLPVKNLPAWSAMVTDTVKQAKGRVKYWEVWNEPPNGIGRGQTAADYAKIMISTYDAAHAADSNSMVGLTAKSVHVNWLEQTIKAGAKDHFDWITVHPYEVLNGIADNIGTEAIYMHIVPTIRKMLAVQNPAKVNVPIIFTEIGTDARKGADNQGQTLVKAYTMGIAQGVACIEWFEGMDGDSGPMGLLDGRGKPRPSYTAMAQMIKHLGPQPAYLGWVLLNGRDYGFVFQGAKGTVLVTWAPRGTPDPIKFGQVVQIVDPLTGKEASASTYELAVAPILVLDVPADLVTQAQANKSKPFPWGGDYSNARSVSVTMGERNIEKGLHTQAGDRVAKAVIAYGGSAREGNVPGGNVFMVDPNFLSYTSTPIEISIVVRRNAANDSAGFKLNYESTDGFRNCGWYTVPDNKEWHTVKWTIKDAQFVNYWGFNFSLDSDGNKYNKYLIQSVTVTKLNQ